MQRDFFAEHEGRGGVLGLLPIGLFLLRAVNAVEPDTLGFPGVQYVDRIAVEDGDDGAGEVVGKNRMDR